MWPQKRHVCTSCCDPVSFWGKVFRKVLLISLRFKGGKSNTILPLPSCALSSFPRSSQLGFLHFCSVFSGFQLSGLCCSWEFILWPWFAWG